MLYLQKAKKGTQKPGHKYTSRTWDAQRNRWVYEYPKRERPTGAERIEEAVQAHGGDPEAAREVQRAKAERGLQQLKAKKYSKIQKLRRKLKRMSSDDPRRAATERVLYETERATLHKYRPKVMIRKEGKYRMHREAQKPLQNLMRKVAEVFHYFALERDNEGNPVIDKVTGLPTILMQSEPTGKKVERPVVDPKTGLPKLDKKGKVVTEQVSEFVEWPLLAMDQFGAPRIEQASLHPETAAVFQRMKDPKRQKELEKEARLATQREKADLRLFRAFQHYIQSGKRTLEEFTPEEQEEYRRLYSKYHVPRALVEEKEKEKAKRMADAERRAAAEARSKERLTDPHSRKEALEQGEKVAASKAARRLMEQREGLAHQVERRLYMAQQRGENIGYAHEALQRIQALRDALKMARKKFPRRFKERESRLERYGTSVLSVEKPREEIEVATTVPGKKGMLTARELEQQLTKLLKEAENELQQQVLEFAKENAKTEKSLWIMG